MSKKSELLTIVLGIVTHPASAEFDEEVEVEILSTHASSKTLSTDWDWLRNYLDCVGVLVGLFGDDSLPPEYHGATKLLLTGRMVVSGGNYYDPSDVDETFEIETERILAGRWAGIVGALGWNALDAANASICDALNFFTASGLAFAYYWEVKDEIYAAHLEFEDDMADAYDAEHGNCCCYGTHMDDCDGDCEMNERDMENEG